MNLNQNLLSTLSRIEELNEEEQTELIKFTLQESYKSSLFKTAKYLCGYSEVNEHTHGDMIKALESGTKRCLLIMPRGTFKSSIGVVAYSIWRLIRNPNERILIDSELYRNSKNFLREIKAIFKSNAFTSVFGDWESSTWNESEITVSARTKSYKESSITCGGIGTTKVGQHFETIVGDDYNSGNNSASSEARDKVWSHYLLNQAILEPEGTYVIIGTRYAIDDIYGRILEKELGLDPSGKEILEKGLL